MPEGHTIHRIARDHRKWFAEQSMIVCSPQGRFQSESKILSGRKLMDMEAHGKHLFYHWSGKKIVHVHLGLYGKFRLHKNPAPEPKGAVRVRMIGSERTIDLNGPNRCEIINQRQFREKCAQLGQDPLREDACPDTAWHRVSRSRAAIGSLLLNQSVIAGIGNVYRAEILFLLGIHPEKPANQLNRDCFDELWNLAARLMRIGVKYNRIITVDRSQTDKPPSRMNAIERLNIYKRSHCPNCQCKVRSWELGSRLIHACLKCQRK